MWIIAKLGDCHKNTLERLCIVLSSLPMWKRDPRICPWQSQIFPKTCVDQDKVCDKGLKLMNIIKFDSYSVLCFSLILICFNHLFKN